MLVSQTCVKHAQHTARHCPTYTPAHAALALGHTWLRGGEARAAPAPAKLCPSFFKLSSTNVLTFLGLFPHLES